MSVVEGESQLVPLYDKSMKRLRYSDLTMPAMMNLTIAVIQDNLGSFFPIGQQASTPQQDSAA